MKTIIPTSLIFISFLFIATLAHAQNKFAVSATVAPFYGHSRAWGTLVLPAEDGSGTLVSQDWSSEASALGYSVGLNGRYSINPKWSLATGFWFNQSRPKDGNYKGRSNNFAIPIFVNFQSSERKLSPYFSAGTLWNFRTTSRVNVPDVGTVIFKSDRGTRRIAPSVGAGMIYNFDSRFSLVAQPTFTYFIPPADINIRSYQMGLQMQVMLRL
jgi:hypothetical protein